MVGELTVTATTYATLALAIAAMDADTLPAVTDKIELIPNLGGTGWHVVKIVRA